MHSLWRSRDHPLLPYRHPVFGGSPPFCTLLAHIRALVPIGYTPSLSIFQSSLEALAITPPDTWSSMDVVAWFHHRLSAFFSLLDAPPAGRAIRDARHPTCPVHFPTRRRHRAAAPSPFITTDAPPSRAFLLSRTSAPHYRAPRTLDATLSESSFFLRFLTGIIADAPTRAATPTASDT